MAYAFISNGRERKMVRTIKSAVGRMVHRKPSDWDFAVPRILNGYRRRGVVPGLFLFSYYTECHLGCRLDNYRNTKRADWHLKDELRRSWLWLCIALRISIRLVRSSIQAPHEKSSR